MNLEDFVAVSGLPGIYKMVANRSNGLVVSDLDTGKKKFASARKHQFTPLASIGIYTHEDTEDLSVIFKTMLEQIEANPPVSPKSSAQEIVQYFKEILPEFDRDRVNTSDIRKVIKWFTFLNERNLLSLEEEQTKEEDVQNDVAQDSKASKVDEKAAVEKASEDKKEEISTDKE